MYLDLDIVDCDAQELPDDVPIPPNRLLHETLALDSFQIYLVCFRIKRKEFHDFVVGCARRPRSSRRMWSSTAR